MNKKQKKVPVLILIGLLAFSCFGCAKLENQDIETVRRKANSDDANAQTELGWRCLNGKGVKKDYVEAVKWWQKAADQGNPVAQCNLGLAYSEGYGVKRNDLEGFNWYMKSAKQGYRFAQAEVGGFYKYGTGVKQDYAEAFEWFQKAAALNDAGGQQGLGLLYLDGEGVEKDVPKAIEWLKKAAEQGDERGEDAQYLLGAMYLNGNLVDKNYSEAEKWLTKASLQGNVDAKEMLKKIPKNLDFDKTENKYEKAIKQNWIDLSRGAHPIDFGNDILLSSVIEEISADENLVGDEIPKSVEAKEREDGKFDIEISDCTSVDTPCYVDHLFIGHFAGAYAYGFGGFYKSFMGVQQDTLWGTPATNPSTSNTDTALVTQIPRAINPELIGDVTYDFYIVKTMPAKYDEFGKITTGIRSDIRLVSKVVLKYENSSKIEWSNWNKVRPETFQKLCQCYGPDGKVASVAGSPKRNGERDGSEAPPLMSEEK